MRARPRAAVLGRLRRAHGPLHRAAAATAGIFLTGKQMVLKLVARAAVDRAASRAVSTGCMHSVAGLISMDGRWCEPQDDCRVRRCERGRKRARPNRVLKTHGPFVSGSPERYAKHRCAKEKWPRRARQRGCLPAAKAPQKAGCEAQTLTRSHQRFRTASLWDLLQRGQRSSSPRAAT